MKTQIISLESHDDLISVRDRLKWVKTPRVLLVWPKYERVNLRVLDLKVLQRHSDSLGMQLGLVTRRVQVRRDAETLGIPVFDTALAAQKSDWLGRPAREHRIPKPPRRDLRILRASIRQEEPAWRSSWIVRFAGFSMGILAVFSLAGAFLPRATLVLYPEERTQSVTVPVLAEESTPSVTVAGNIPAHRIETIVEVEESQPVVNEILVPHTRSRGIARFTNLSQEDVNIPSGTVVSTSSTPPIRFSTLNPVLLSAGEDEFVEVPIQAIRAGSEGNAPVDTIVVVEGQLNPVISVTNPKLISGGTDRRILGPSDLDREQLRNVAVGILKREAERNLRSQISSNDLFLADTLEITAILEERFAPAAGQAGDRLELRMQVQYSVQYIFHDDLMQLAQFSIAPPTDKGFIPSGRPQFQLKNKPVTDSSGVTKFELHVSRTLLKDIDELRVYSLVRGVEKDRVVALLDGKFSLRDDSQIQLVPDWWPWMPIVPFNIALEIK